MRPINQILAYCNCQEIKDKNGNEYPRIPEWHNCDYIRKRNKLIPKAELYAIENSKSVSGKVDGYKFTQLLSNEMDRLAAELGLV